MASLSVSVNRAWQSGSTICRAHATITFNYSSATPTNPPTTVSVTASSVVVSGISYTGSTQEVHKAHARSSLTTALSSMTATLTFGGQTVASRTGLALSSTYSVSGTKSVNRGTSATTATVTETCDGKTASASISVPARPSYDVTYSANSGSGAPATQKKYYDYNLTLSSGRPTKVDHAFLGWATSTTIAGAGTVNYNPSQTYTANAGLNLYAVWERNYQKPTLGNLHIDRCQQDGTLDDDGTYAKVSFDWGVFRTTDARYYGGSTTPYADNAVDTCTVTVGTQSATPTLTGQSGTASVIVGNGTFDTDQAYTASVSITDTQTIKSDHTTTITGELSKAKFPIDINSTATAIAFLSTAPDDDEGVFCPDMTAQEVQDFVDNLEGGGGSGTADRVIEQGTSGIWTYRKWTSGIAECWGIITWTVTSWSTWGSLYYSNYSGTVNYPSGLFISAPTLTSQSNTSANDSWLGIRSGSDYVNTKDHTNDFFLLRPTAGSASTTAYANVHAIGRWK